MTLETARLHYPREVLTLGVDGYTPHNKAILNDGCCPDPLCIPFCSTACSFVDLLPTGPMWDFQKREALRCLEGCGEDCGDDDCPSMAKYAIYGARVLHRLVQTTLWPAIRESNPATAVTTLDDWLDRYGWQDCYRTCCRSEYLAMFSPYETESVCGGTRYCPTNFSEEFECALKYAILQALVRLQRGVIKNLDGINWVIAPLGAVVSPRQPWPQDVADYLGGDCEVEDGGPPCFCGEAQFEICNSVDTLPGCPIEACLTSPTTVPALQSYQCEDEPAVFLYPGVVAAECIVRSMLNNKAPTVLRRCTVAQPS